MKAAALLVAAGGGERLGAGRPKAFVALAGRPMLEWSLDALREAGIADVVVALPAEPAGAGAGDRAGGAALAAAVDWPPPRGVLTVAGGATRSASVRNALAAAPADADAIVVHDAARPLVEPGLFARTLAALDAADGAIAAAPVTDTIKQAGPGNVVERTLDRSTLWAVQTPQAFRRDALAEALDAGDDVLARATDDAWLVERAGGRVVVVPSTARNLKVTTAVDLDLAARLLGAAG